MTPENRKKTGKRGANRTSFKPGQSGNPGGRPRKTPEMRHVEDLAKEHTGKAVQGIVELMESPDHRVRLAACEEILNRGWGKPRERVEAAIAHEGRAVQAVDEILAKALQTAQPASPDTKEPPAVLTEDAGDKRLH